MSIVAVGMHERQIKQCSLLPVEVNPKIIASEFVSIYSNSNVATAKPSFSIRLLWLSMIIMIVLALIRNIALNLLKPYSTKLMGPRRPDTK